MDRYTLIRTDVDSLASKIEAAQQLGLEWLVLGNDSHYFNLFVFFDAAGRYNFLRGEFGDGADDARKWVRENIPELADLENDVQMSELVVMVAQYTQTGK